jgi:hypothetical protein
VDDLSNLHRKQIDARLRVAALTEAMAAKDLDGLDALTADLDEVSPEIRHVLYGFAWLLVDALEAGDLDPRVWLAEQRAAVLADPPPIDG